MTKLVADFKYGTLSAGIGSTDTTITSAEFADLPVVSSPDTMDLVLNPGEVGGDAEIVTVTAHTSASTSVTVAARTGSAHGSGTQWVHAVTAADFNRMGFDGNLEGNADTATTATNLSGGTVDATTVTASGDLTVDTDTLHVDAANDRVGIGTTTPLAALDMSDGSIAFGADSSGNALGGPFGLEVYNNDTSGSAASLEGALYYRTTPNVWVFEDGAGADILSMDTDDLSAAFGGVGSFVGRLTASGGIDGLTLANGGISGSNYNITGVNQLEIADPGEGIVFKGGASGDYSVYLIDDSADKILHVGGVTNSRLRVNSPSGNAEVELNTSGVRWALFANASDNSFNLYNTIGSTDFTFTTSGRLGINDTTPSYELDVAGQIRATSHMLANGNMYIGSNGGGDSYLYFWDDNSDAWREIFWDDSENRFRSSHNIKFNGYVHAGNNMYVGDNGGGDSDIYFYDDGSNTWRTFQWDDSFNGWRVEDDGGTMRTLWHSGNSNSYSVDWYANQAFADNWFRATGDTGFYFQSHGTGIRSPISEGGTYGSVATYGGEGGWEGYSIGGRVVFMHNMSNDWGIYNDVNNEWMLWGQLNGTVQLYHNNSVKMRTESDGVRVYGHLYPDTDNSRQLGKSGNAWDHFWLQQGNTFSSGGYWTLRSRDSDRQVMEYVSSERFKKDIEDLPLSEAYQILDARVIKFRGIDDDDDVPLEAGLSAESLHEAGFEYAVRYDEGHWGETPRSVYYDMLTAPLIKICKDLHDRLAALEAG